MKIKAVIFDLDDTLYDCTGSLIDASRSVRPGQWLKQDCPAAKKRCMPCKKELTEKHGPYHLVFNEIVNKYGADRKLVTLAYKAYNNNRSC